MEVISRTGDSRQAASGRVASRHSRSLTQDFTSPRPSASKAQATETLNQEATLQQTLTADKDKAAVKSGAKTSFDPLLHKVPRLDRFGFNDDPMNARNMLQRATKNILAEPVNVPAWWQEKRIAGSQR